eukprot:11838046-Alexandrium_andersonii.AAC.1
MGRFGHNPGVPPRPPRATNGLAHHCSRSNLRHTTARRSLAQDVQNAAFRVNRRQPAPVTFAPP